MYGGNGIPKHMRLPLRYYALEAVVVVATVFAVLVWRT